jgi:hypothetical protein
MCKNTYREFIAALGPCEPPVTVYYSDEKPPVCTGPKGGFFIDIRGPKDLLLLPCMAKKLMQQKKEKFRCMFYYLGQTKKKKIPSVFDEENSGCPGCRFYLGFIKDLPLFNHYFISKGFPVLYKGERLAPSPASSKKHADLLKGVQPKARYVIFESFGQIVPLIQPELVIFFCNAEIFCGLAALVRYVTDEADAVPSSSGL